MALGGVRLHVWEAFWANLAPTWKPKRLQNRGRNLKKSMLKNNTFLASIFKGFGPRFGRVFGRFLGCKTAPKAKKHFFKKRYKTLAMCTRFKVLPFENLWKNGRKLTKNVLFLQARFWLDFLRFLERVWEAKILDFRLFGEKKRKQKTRWFLEGQKIAFWGLKSKLRALCGGMCGSGGRNIGWGKCL